MSEPQSIYVLFAPYGQLSGDGQLRESFHERRDRKGADYPMWYLTPELVREFKISEESGLEAVAALDASTIAWLKLRFGGKSVTCELDVDQLSKSAVDAPPPPVNKDISLKSSSS